MVRVKSRYVLCEVFVPGDEIASVEINSQDVFYAVKASILETHGDFGLGSLQSSIKVKYVNPDTNIVIIRAHRDFFNLLASAIVFITKIGKHSVMLRSLHVGGTIRSCQKFLIDYHRQNMTSLYPQCITDEHKASVISSIMATCEQFERPGLVRRERGATQDRASTALDILASGDV